jgi:hypothetical protein
MPATNAFVRGHQEVGHVITGPTDVPWGKTAEEAVQLQMNVTTVDLFSAQSKMNEDTGITQVGMDIQINGIDGALRNVGRVFGLPDAAFSGTLPAGEELKFEQNDIGETERHIYSEGPGAGASTRRISAPRCKLVNVGPLAQSKTGWFLPTATWRVLNPSAGIPVVTITDAVAQS